MAFEIWILCAMEKRTCCVIFDAIATPRGWRWVTIFFHRPYIMNICSLSAFRFRVNNIIFYQSTSKKIERLLGLSLHVVKTRRNEQQFIILFNTYAPAWLKGLRVGGMLVTTESDYISRRKVNFFVTQTPAYILLT